MVICNGSYDKQIYEQSFGTAYETHKQSVLKKGSSIRLQDAKGYLRKRGGIQVITKPDTFNSFVSPGAKFEFGIDLMDIGSKGAASNHRYGLTAINNFNKIAEVAPR